MAENSKIQWTDHTFNPWRGCTKIAPGCVNCYADAQSKRNPGTLGVWGPSGTRVLASEAMWREPGKWNRCAEIAEKAWSDTVREVGSLSAEDGEAYLIDVGLIKPERPRVFCASLADVFEDWPGAIQYPNGTSMPPAIVNLDCVRDRLFRLIDATPNLDWLLLTKRPENVRRMWCPRPITGAICSRDEHIEATTLHRSNVWLGTSIACQDDADRNIPELLKCRDLAAKLFLSIEPLIGPVMLHHWIDESGAFRHAQGVDVDWVIVGGESGPHARPCNVEWIRSIVRQCQAAGVPCFVKQVGAWPVENVNTTMPWIVRDPKGGDPSEWPEDLRVREFPCA